MGSFRLSLCTKSVVEILLSFLSLLFCFFSCAAEFSIRISSKVLGGEKNRKIEARKKRDTRHQCRTATEADRREETDGRWARQGRESFKGGFGWVALIIGFFFSEIPRIFLNLLVLMNFVIFVNFLIFIFELPAWYLWITWYIWISCLIFINFLIFMNFLIFINFLIFMNFSDLFLIFLV